MQSVVHKFTFPRFADEGTFEMSGKAAVLHAGMQGDDFCIWVHVPMDDSKKYRRRFIIRGTGHFIPEGLFRFVSTIFYGSYVFHVFEDSSWVSEYVKDEYYAMPSPDPVFLPVKMETERA